MRDCANCSLEYQKYMENQVTKKINAQLQPKVS